MQLRKEMRQAEGGGDHEQIRWDEGLPGLEQDEGEGEEYGWGEGSARGDAREGSEAGAEGPTDGGRADSSPASRPRTPRGQQPAQRKRKRAREEPE